MDENLVKALEQLDEMIKKLNENRVGDPNFQLVITGEGFIWDDITTGAFLELTSESIRDILPIIERGE